MNKFRCRKAQKAGVCTDAFCCGLLPFPEEFLDRYKHFMRGEQIKRLEVGDMVVVVTSDGKCCFLSRRRKECMIYENRPMVCRNYGHVPGLPCPYMDMEGNIRSEEEIQKTKEWIASRISDVKVGASDIAKFERIRGDEESDNVPQ